jgi:hypothetical protein
MLLLALLMGLVTLVAYYDDPIKDADLWWHMAYGREVVETGSLQVDHTRFAWTPDEADWVYVTWLGDLALWGTHALGGTSALSALQIGLYALIAILFFRSVPGSTRQAAMVTILLVVLAFLSMRSTTVLLKNTMFSVAFYAVLFTALGRFRQGRTRWLLVLPPLFLAWVNTHGEVTLAAAALASYTALELVLAVMRNPAALPESALRRLLLAATASAAALLANPQGWRLPAYWLRRALGEDQVAGQGLIADTIAPHTRLLFDGVGKAPWALAVWIWLLLTLVAVARLGVLVKRRQWDQAPLMLVCLGCTLASWTMARLLPLGVTAWLFSVGVWLASRGALATPRARRVLLGSLALLMAGAVWTRIVVQPGIIGRSDRLTSAQPVAAARFVAEHDLPGPLFNDYLTGGYLIWALDDELPVFIDPRYGPYEPHFRAAYFHFEREPDIDELETFTSNAEVRTAVVRHRGWQGQMCLFFQDAPSWELVFVGPNAAVYVHRDALTPELAARASQALRADNFAGERNVSVLAGIQRALLGTSPGEVLRLSRIAEHNVPDYKLMKRELRRAFRNYCISRAFTGGRDASRELSPERVRQRFAMYYLNGNIDLARLVATGYLARHPGDADMHYNLACAEARAGDLAMAAEALAAALRHGYDRLEAMQRDPDLAPLRETAAYERLLAKWSRTVAAAAIVGGASGGTR